MVVGLVFKDVDSCSDSRGELTMIKTCLVQEIQQLKVERKPSTKREKPTANRQKPSAKRQNTCSKRQNTSVKRQNTFTKRADASWRS